MTPSPISIGFQAWDAPSRLTVSGKLAGYAGGLDAKQFLLALEQRYR